MFYCADNIFCSIAFQKRSRVSSDKYIMQLFVNKFHGNKFILFKKRHPIVIF